MVLITIQFTIQLHNVSFIWIDESYESVLCCEPIIRRSGYEIINTLNNYITTKGIDWTKCIGIENRKQLHSSH